MNNLFQLWAKQNLAKAESSKQDAENVLFGLRNTDSEYAAGLKQLIKAHKEVALLWAGKIGESKS